MKAHNMYNSWMQHLFELISFLATVPEPSNFSHVRACICKEWQKMVYTVDFGVKFVAISCGSMRRKVVSPRSLWIFSNLMVWLLHVLHLWAGWWNPNQHSCLWTYIGIDKLVVVVLVWKVASPHFNTSYQMILLKKSSKSVVKLIPSSSCWTSTRPQDKSMLLQGQQGW